MANFDNSFGVEQVLHTQIGLLVNADHREVEAGLFSLEGVLLDEDAKAVVIVVVSSEDILGTAASSWWLYKTFRLFFLHD